MFKLSIEDEKSALKALAMLLAGIFLASMCMVILSFAAFTVVHLLRHGCGADSIRLFGQGLARSMENPGYFFAVYADWWRTLQNSIRTLNWQWYLFIPLVAPVLSVMVLWLIISKGSYSFSLWYILNHHFAKLDDVRKMGLLKGILLVLGRFEGHVLGLCKPAAVLCLGETGCGKTTTVAIPSILRSDNNSVVAVDNTGALARYTSGYRAGLGKVFYFNWDLLDDPEKGAFYPRWNPLAADNLPPVGEQRENYVRFLASYIVAGDGQVIKDNYWDWLAAGALGAFISFLAAKCAQAAANDYFLNKILENGRLNKDDKDVLLSYYALMPKEYAHKAITDINKESLTVDDYFPIGSWDGIPSAWQGKDLCPGMLTDWLLKNYLSAKDEGGKDDWRHWLDQLGAEAILFNYGAPAVRGLQQFLYLSKQQRQLVFAYVLKPLRVFLNQTLRERTCGNDLRMADLSGIYNQQERKWEPVSVYSAANTKTSKFVSRLFIEMLMRFGMLETATRGPLPILMVLDDAGQMLRLSGLAECVAKGPGLKTSFLLLSNGLTSMEEIYGKETLENLVANTSYKIIMAETGAKMCRQLNKLAIFATSSVQIPQGQNRRPMNKKYFADASYYHRLANDLQVRNSNWLETKGYQLLLAEGYYHRPVLTSNVHFLRDLKFRGKAMIEASYFVSPELAARRNAQDMKVPDMDEVLLEHDLGIDDEVELDQYMSLIFDEAKSKVPEDDKMETVMINDISDKWNKISSGNSAQSGLPAGEWWLDEAAFGSDKNAEQNPFAPKK